MIRLLISAPASGCGKTAVACALLRVLCERGFSPCAFKCGPDYIDPMFHRAVLGVESHNLDLFLGDDRQVRTLFARSCRGHGAAVVEGAMGFYDGLGGVSTRAGAWELAVTLALPVLLVLPVRGAGLTLAAQLRGLRDFRPDSRIAGVMLNECSSALYRTLAPLLTAQEIADLDGRISLLARALEENADLPRLLALFDGPAPESEALPAAGPPRCRIAVARDEAFCFCYAETLETLSALGAEPVFFSPLHDAALPEHIGGLYLPGGYPELHAARLSENIPMRTAVARAVQGGLPTVAECGGYLYLTEALFSPEGLSDGGCPAGRGEEHGRAAPLRLCGASGAGGQPALSCGRALPRPRVPLLGCICERQCLSSGKAAERQKLVRGLCGQKPVCRLPAPVFCGGPSAGGAFCPRGHGIRSKAWNCMIF